LKGSPCLEFTYTLTPLAGGPLTKSLATEFINALHSAVNEDGSMYTKLLKEHPETKILGLGYPGKGIPLNSEFQTYNTNNPDDDIAGLSYHRTILYASNNNRQQAFSAESQPGANEAKCFTSPFVLPFGDVTSIGFAK